MGKERVLAWLFVPVKNLEDFQFVPELEDSTLDSRSLAPNIEQSVTSRGKHMQRRYWSSAWKKGGWIRLLSGMTCPHSRATVGAEKWIWSLRDSLANLTQSLADSKATKTSDTSGLSSSGLSEKCSPPWCSSKMSQDSLPGFDLSERNYQEWATSLRRDSLARRKSEQVISGKGCSSWLTPKSPSGGGQPERVTPGGGLRKLEDQAECLWGTPNARDWKGTGMEGQLGTQVLSLQAQETEEPGQQSSESGLDLPRLWMTPKSGQCGSTAKTKGRPIEMATHLTTQTHTWKTPHGIHRFDRHGKMGGPGELGHQAKHCQTPNKGKKLNPLFVEWLMGYPIGWTAFEPVEMESYLSRQRGLLSILRESWD